MARGLKGRGSRLGERTVSGRPSRGLSGRGGMGLPGPGESACGLIPGLRSPGPLGRKGRRCAARSPLPPRKRPPSDSTIPRGTPRGRPRAWVPHRSFPMSAHATGTTNRLAGESSPYLLLHQHNPVDWYPWGEEAIETARREDKPIFLSVGYSTSYWCHVMERESFSNPQIAELMNREFINVKLDREERPDLDEIYMAATQILTSQGGWPNSVFLNTALMPF